MATPRIKPAIALSEAEERDAYPHPGRRLSKYEALYREKPLPKVPDTARRASQPTIRRKLSMPLSYQTSGQQYSQPQPLPQASAASLVTLPLQDQWATASTLRTSRSLHISEVASSQSMAGANRKSSFSRGALGPRSSRKVNNLIGHDLDLPPVDPFSDPRDRTSFSSAAGYSEGTSSSGSDSDDCHDGQSTSGAEHGLLPLLLEVDEGGFCSREILWVPRTPGAMMSSSPLGPRHGKSDSDGSVSLSNGGHSPTIGLSGELPVRLTPGHGPFTDKRAANDYHRFAAELATPRQIERASESAAAPSTRQQSPEPTSKTARVAEKFRGTAAFIRMWDSSRPKEAKPPAPPPMPPPILPPLPSPSSSSFSLIELARSASPTPSYEEEAIKISCPPPVSAVGIHPPPSPRQYRLFPRQNTVPPPQLQLPLRRRPQSPQSNSAFECDSDDGQDDGGRDGGRRWWRQSDEEGRGSWSSEVPSAHRLRRQEENKERPPRSSSSTSGVKGLLANARDRSWLPQTERRRVNLRKSIKVLYASELDEGGTDEGGAQKDAPKATNKSKRLKMLNLESYFDGQGVFL